MTRDNHPIARPGGHYRTSPSSVLLLVKGMHGKTAQERHSSLKPMDELCHLDIVCFMIDAGSKLDGVLEPLTR